MTSFIRISDIPHGEMRLLPIIGLRQQIQEDRNRSQPAALSEFVTDWQLPNNPVPSALAPFHGDSGPVEGGGFGDDDDFRDDHFDWRMDEGRGDEDENFEDEESHQEDDDLDALHRDIGGEG